MGAPLDDDALDAIFREARSFNGYDATPVAQADVEAIYDLLKMGPTSANQHPARFIWCLDQNARDRLADCASEGNADKIRKAPAAVIIAMDNRFHDQLPWLFPHTDARSWFEGGDKEAQRAESAFRNATLQGAYLLVAARALGWDTGPMSGFDGDRVKAAFFAEEAHWQANFIATLGKGDRSTLHGRSPRPDFDAFNRIA